MSKIVKTVRTLRGLSQKELSQKTGIPTGYISLLEAGQFNPTPDQVSKLQSALGVDFEAARADFERFLRAIGEG